MLTEEKELDLSNMTDKEKLIAITEHMIGEENNKGEKRVLDVAVEDSIVGIGFNADMNYDEESTLWGINNDVVSILAGIDAYGGFEDKELIIITANVIIEDEYGNESSVTARMLGIEMKELEKINFENFDADNLEQIGTVTTNKMFE